MSSFNVSEYISCILINNEKVPDPCKNNAFDGSERGDSGGFSANQSKPWRHGEHIWNSYSNIKIHFLIFENIFKYL